MKLIYLGEELDPTQEIELFSQNKFGFKVSIKYNGKNHYVDDFAMNCTEVHHLWSLDYMGGPSIAFESDIHRTGFLRRVDHINSVTIELAEELYPKHNLVP